MSSTLDLLSGKKPVKKAKIVNLGKKGKIKIKHPGALTRKAKAAGESTQEFAQAHKHDKGLTGKQARLDIAFSHMNHKR